MALAPSWTRLDAQDLAPRAYVISPRGAQAVFFSSSFNSGSVVLDPTVPVEDANGSFQVPLAGYYTSFSLFGRSANVTGVVPYVHGTFQGTVASSSLQAYRSGLGDTRVRFAVNLYGGRSMKPREYARWKEKRLIGASLTLNIPTGQYDPAKLINVGTNRWGLKPEIGFTRRWDRWAADWYFGAWFFTANNAYFPGKSVRTQSPLISGEGHLGYYVRPRLWASFDANFWVGSRSTVDGIEKHDQQRNSRIGATVSVPLSDHHSVKFSYSRGAYVTVGGDFRAIAVSWQYSWIGKPL